MSVWRHEGFVNPYGDEWWTSVCQHQYDRGEAYETGYNACLEALEPLIRKIAPSSKLIDILYSKV